MASHIEEALGGGEAHELCGVCARLGQRHACLGQHLLQNLDLGGVLHGEARGGAAACAGGAISAVTCGERRRRQRQRCAVLRRLQLLLCTPSSSTENADSIT